MTSVGTSSLKQLAAAAAGQNAHPTNPSSTPGDRLRMADGYRNMYMQWHVALSQAPQSPLDLTLLMQEVIAEICSTPVAEGELLLGKDEALLEVTGDGKRLNLVTREVCVATEGEFPISRVHELYRRTVEKLNPHFDAHFAPTENRLITVGHLSTLQQRTLKQYENEALETIWNRKLAEEFNLQNNPDLQTHEQIRAWFNDPINAPQLQQITLLDLSQLGLKTLPPEIGALRNVQVLQLYNNQLRSLPPEIGALVNLHELNLNGNQFRSFPPQIGVLLNLEKLFLSYNQLRSLSPEISALTNLKELTLSNNQLCSLPSKIGALTNLQELRLDRNQLRSLPSEIGALHNLQRLELHNNQLSSLPSEIGTLGNLEALGLSLNKLRSLPTEIGNLGNLQELLISNNHLRSLPTEIGTLANLQMLDLDNNQLCSLPTEIGALGNLEVLDLNNNLLRSLPTEIGALSALRQLELSCNQLRSLPSEISALTNLQELSLDRNQLRSLPSEISSLSNLEVLDLNNNLLRSLPSEIGTLANLRELLIANNQLRSLPSEIGTLANLQMLDLDNNQLCSLPPEISALNDLEILERDNNPWMFMSDQKLAKKPSLAAFLRLNKEFMEYPTQSSLGNLFKLIARNEDAAAIQNTFEELDAELQNRIKDLANAEVLIPVAASSNWTPNTDENFFSNISRLSRAVKKATFEKFWSLSQVMQSLVYNKIRELAGNPKTVNPLKWDEDHAFENILRFVDALEEVTKQTTEESEPKKRRLL